MLCACSTIIFSGWEGSSFSICERVGVSACACVSRSVQFPQSLSVHALSLQTRFHLGQRLLKAFAESIQKTNFK